MRSHTVITLSVLSLVLALSDICRGGLSEQQLYGLASEAAGHFRRGNELVKSDPAVADEQYAMALRRYERMVEEGGIANPFIYYNMGNVYLMQKDLGRAILHFKRAEQFDQNFPDLQKNLNYARGQRIDQIGAQTEERILQTLFFWHYDFNRHTKLTVVAIAWSAVWALAIVRILQGYRPWLRAGLWIFGVLVLALSVSVGVAHRGAGVTEGVILAEQVTARQGDGMNYPESFEQPLHAGTEFILREQRQDWYLIELQNGEKTWINSASAALVQRDAG